MSQSAPQKDLVVLVADAHIRGATKGLLSRSENLGIAQIDFDITPHNPRDPGCRTQAKNYLRQYLRYYVHSLVIFDRHGCTSDDSRTDIQNRVESDLRKNGWEDRAKAIVIEPELEAWVWGYQEALPVLGWQDGYDSLRQWLRQEGLWPVSAAKPPDPKKAMKAVMEHTKQKPGEKVFEQIARAANFKHCQDAAFNELRNTLQLWFPLGSSP